MPSVEDGRALKLVLRPGHGGPEMYTLSWPLSGGWDPKERPLSSHWLDQKSLEAKHAVCSVGAFRPHPDSGLWCSGVCGLGVEDWPLLLPASSHRARSC